MCVYAVQAGSIQDRSDPSFLPSFLPSCFVLQHPSEIYSEENGFRLFLGSAEHASDLPSLEERRITCILNMAAGKKGSCSNAVCNIDNGILHGSTGESSCQMTPEVYGDGYRVMRIAAEDLEEYDISPHILPALDFILEARRRGEGILVHCVAGASRSSTVVIAYFMIQ